MILQKKILSFREINTGKVEITDPGYAKGSNCRMSSVPLQKGNYRLAYYNGLKHEQEDIDDMKKTFPSVVGRQLTQTDIDSDLIDMKSRIFVIEITRENDVDITLDSPEWKEIGCIGVDSAKAGFFWDIPDNFTYKQWDSFCRNFNKLKRSVKADKYGFYCTSGYGDGRYKVFAIKENDEAIALRIDFGD